MFFSRKTSSNSRLKYVTISLTIMYNYNTSINIDFDSNLREHVFILTFLLG